MPTAHRQRTARPAARAPTIIPIGTGSSGSIPKMAGGGEGAGLHGGGGGCGGGGLGGDGGLGGGGLGGDGGGGVQPMFTMPELRCC